MTISKAKRGDGDKINEREAMVQILKSYRFLEISAGSYFSLLLDNSGKVWSFGRNVSGQLGRQGQYFSNPPAAIPALKDIVRISTGAAFGLALDKKGFLSGWGQNEDGEISPDLGDMGLR